MIFQSKYPGCTIHLRDPVYYTHQDTGFREMTRPSLVADFMNPSFVGMTVDGEDGLRHPVIQGGTFDTDEAAERLGWTEEEKAYAEQKLGAFARDPRFTDVWLWEPPVPELPWPTFNECHHLEVAKLAEAVGKLDEALAYLCYENKWPGVQEQLTEKIEERDRQREAEAALTA